MSLRSAENFEQHFSAGLRQRNKCRARPRLAAPAYPDVTGIRVQPAQPKNEGGVAGLPHPKRATTETRSRSEAGKAKKKTTDRGRGQHPSDLFPGLSHLVIDGAGPDWQAIPSHAEVIEFIAEVSPSHRYCRSNFPRSD